MILVLGHSNHIFMSIGGWRECIPMTFRKAEYITDFAAKVQNGEFDLQGIRGQSDEEAIKELSALKGIGVWTTELILLFCLQRPNIFSFDDLAIKIFNSGCFFRIVAYNMDNDKIKIKY